MMGVRTPETCWAVNTRQNNKLEKLLHLVCDLFFKRIVSPTRTSGASCPKFRKNVRCRNI
jgi:hypothetical protein